MYSSLIVSNQEHSYSLIPRTLPDFISQLWDKIWECPGDEARAQPSHASTQKWKSGVKNRSCGSEGPAMCSQCFVALKEVKAKANRVKRKYSAFTSFSATKQRLHIAVNALYNAFTLRAMTCHFGARWRQHFTNISKIHPSFNFVFAVDNRAIRALLCIVFDHTYIHTYIMCLAYVRLLYTHIHTPSKISIGMLISWIVH